MIAVAEGSWDEDVGGDGGFMVWGRVVVGGNWVEGDWGEMGREMRGLMGSVILVFELY